MPETQPGQVVCWCQLVTFDAVPGDTNNNWTIIWVYVQSMHIISHNHTHTYKAKYPNTSIKVSTFIIIIIIVSQVGFINPLAVYNTHTSNTHLSTSKTHNAHVFLRSSLGLCQWLHCFHPAPGPWAPQRFSTPAARSALMNPSPHKISDGWLLTSFSNVIHTFRTECASLICHKKIT